MKLKSIVVAALIVMSGSAAAQCVGSNQFATCTDMNGNSYTVNRMGGMTTVQGMNSNGNTWNETTTNVGGGMSMTHGTDSNGNSWNETQTNLGGGMHSVTGTDSNGNSYSHICSQFGCN